MLFVRQQLKEKDAKQARERKRSAGKADLGGPFHLTDHHGNERTNKDYIGKWLMIYFGFTFCPDICPDELEKLGVVLEQLGMHPMYSIVYNLHCICMPHTWIQVIDTRTKLETSKHHLIHPHCAPF